MESDDDRHSRHSWPQSDRGASRSWSRADRRSRYSSPSPDRRSQGTRRSRPSSEAHSRHSHRTPPLRLPTFRFPPDKIKATILEVLDRIRQYNIHHDIDIPELVMCGKQSAGKSSVLEAITGLEFPKGDGGPCTRFVIEIRLFPDAEEPYIKSKVRFRPETDRGGAIGTGFEIIAEAKIAMNITDTNKFSPHVLSIEYHFPDPEARVNAPRLTLIDLPGLIAVDQGLDLAGLTKRYIQRESALILAVVDAVNDLETHEILKMAQTVDPMCRRTFGILTKPDLTVPGSDLERNWVLEALDPGKAKYFKSGSHVLYNRNSIQIKPGSHYKDIDDRDRQERDFFKSSHRMPPNAVELGDTRKLPNAWNQLFNTEKWGVVHLRDRLLLLLSDMAVSQLGSIYTDISAALEKRRAKLDRLTAKDPAKHKGEYRDLLQMLGKLADQASSGNYKNSDFFVIMRDGPMWLRSRIIEQGNVFSKKMRTDGHNSTDFKWKPDEPLPTSPANKEVGQMLDLLVRTKSGSHPADFNPDRIDLIFPQFSIHWNAIATEYVGSCYRCCEEFAREAVRFVVKDVSVAERLLAKEILRALAVRKSRALMTLRLIEADRKDGAMSVNPDLWMDSRELMPPSQPAPAQTGQEQQASTSQTGGRLGTQARKEFEELEAVRRLNALRLLQNMLTLYKASFPLDDQVKFEMIMEGPDKTERLKRQEGMKLEVDILEKALEDLEPLLGKFSSMEGKI
ncbi:interferon-induced GTP-binding Mx [Diplogelasinospora grovesii]|uniref:Interferon-induced GTP-binding Mx n=1 Tax=Diplogelasinospora grovesii TaxID=303347 RepID=A0AAN6S2P5_9PEZI|nr:interferon-induced GTP-binding Mx [Diplogelasinospora grovesii]